MLGVRAKAEPENQSQRVSAIELALEELEPENRCQRVRPIELEPEPELGAGARAVLFLLVR